jgi:hypothetical protein
MAGMLVPVRKHLVAPRHPAFCSKTGPLRILKQALEAALMLPSNENRENRSGGAAWNKIRP